MNTPLYKTSGISNSSLITRFSQVLALFIALSISGLLTFILMSESINANAGKINLTGSLRMLASKIPHSQQSAHALKPFQQRLDLVRSKIQIDLKNDPDLSKLFESIEATWMEMSTHGVQFNQPGTFADDLDRLVTYFQHKTEQQIKQLRLIQFFGFFSVLLISFISIYRLRRRFISPFQQLVSVANQVGKGNFTAKADETGIGELGQLAQSLNDMSQQLSITYQGFENKVSLKNQLLEQTNRSLNILYRSADSLSAERTDHTLSELILELETALGAGHVYARLDKKENSLPLGAPIDSSVLLLSHRYPINKNGLSFGTLIWQTTKQLTPQPWQQELLSTMANLFASSFDSEHKQRAEGRLQILEERAVIARELHDSLAQSLSYLKFQVSLLKKQLGNQLAAANVTATINEISEASNTSYKQLREVLTTFRLKLDNDSIESSIRELIHKTCMKSAVQINLDYKLRESTLSPNQEIHLLQIIREALSNIQKHADASQATVTAFIKNDIIYVEICDNGCGLVDVHVKEGHFGLIIMQERARSLSGTLDISANTPSGTKISLTFNPSLNNTI